MSIEHATEIVHRQPRFQHASVIAVIVPAAARPFARVQQPTGAIVCVPLAGRAA